MELQWPLILFTTFIAWSAGLFGTLGIVSLRGRGSKIQVATLVVTLVLMAIGGIAVFFHLQHWERIFNGFGHITSGITQELIGIVLMVLVMVVYFALVRRSEDGLPPKWCSVLAIAVAVVLVFVMGHSYMMASRPAWDSAMQILSLLGASCLLGPATLAVIADVAGDDTEGFATMTLAGSIVNAVASVVYLVVMASVEGAFTDIGYYYDPTQIVRGMIDTDAATSLLYGSRVALVVVVVVCVLAPIVLAAVKKTRGAGRTGHWKATGGVMVACGIVAAIALRVVFYELGTSIYMFFG